MSDVTKHLRENYIIYIVCCIALLACVWTIFSVEGWRYKIDDEYKGFINDHCVCYIRKPSIDESSTVPFKLMTPKEMYEFEKSNITIEFIDEVEDYGIEDFYKDAEGFGD